MNEAHIVRRLRAYGNEADPMTRWLINDAIFEIVSWRAIAIVFAAATCLTWLWHLNGGQL
jgi:hypothetical protein